MKTLILTATDGTKRVVIIASSAVVVPAEPPAEPPPFDAKATAAPYRTEFTFKTAADAERGIRYKKRPYICMVDGSPMRVAPSHTGHGAATCSPAEEGAFEREVAAFVAEKRAEWQAAYDDSTARAAVRIAGGADSNLFLDLTCRETVEEIGQMLTDSTANPTESEIARRVELNWETERRFYTGEWKPEEWPPKQMANVKAQFRRDAIRQLLAERGAK